MPGLTMIVELPDIMKRKESSIMGAVLPVVERDILEPDGIFMTAGRVTQAEVFHQHHFHLLTVCLEALPGIRSFRVFFSGMVPP